VVEVGQQAGREHHRRVDHDEDQEPDEHEEVQRARDLDAEGLADPLEPRRHQNHDGECGATPPSRAFR
jgi:hypothetical protein